MTGIQDVIEKDKRSSGQLKGICNSYDYRELARNSAKISSSQLKEVRDSYSYRELMRERENEFA